MPKPPQSLYIITGTSRGLGKALAAAAEAVPSAHVITLSREPASASRPNHYGVDLADAAALASTCTAVAAALAGQSWRRAVLINNAGVVAPVMPLARADRDALARNIAVNLSAPMLLMQWFAATIAVGAQHASIINISSGAGRRPIAGWAAYCATKAGLDMASRAMAEECAAAALPLTVTSLAPGIIDTDMQAEIRNTTEDKFADVERFRAFKAEGALASAEAVAEKIIALDAAGKLPAGLADVREL
jgi:benzil reductase ((S)-benzoin forming)